jgi:hypothetical protein
MCPSDDDYFDCYGSDEEEAYEALSWSQRLDMLEEMCELLGMDSKEFLKPPPSHCRRATNRAVGLATFLKCTPDPLTISSKP